MLTTRSGIVSISCKGILNFNICNNFVFTRFIKLRYDLGKGVGEAKSNLTVSVNTWYTVRVSRTGKSGSLTVNSNTPVSVISPGSAVALDVHSKFYLGGVRKLSTVNPKAVDSSVQDFSGCIEQFEVLYVFNTMNCVGNSSFSYTYQRYWRNDTI